jgi:hypothetical protein
VSVDVSPCHWEGQTLHVPSPSSATLKWGGRKMTRHNRWRQQHTACVEIKQYISATAPRDCGSMCTLCCPHVGTVKSFLAVYAFRAFRTDACVCPTHQKLLSLNLFHQVCGVTGRLSETSGHAVSHVRYANQLPLSSPFRRGDCVDSWTRETAKGIFLAFSRAHAAPVCVCKAHILFPRRRVCALHA